MLNFTYLAEAATPLFFPLVAVIGAAIHSRSGRTRLSRAEIWFRWWAVAALGGGSLWMTVSFLTIPETMTEMIGFQNTPFVTEIAFANLGLAVLGIRAVHAAYRERVTIGLGAGMFLWGATLGHLYQWIANGDTAPGNIGAVLIYDVLLPVLLIVLAMQSRKQEHQPADRSDASPVQVS
ncbi:MAG: hypothetical protein L0G87_03735 [Renibacterium salmoninarum]|nr:hypothetical protein [Renibacterium salmoninarum]